MNTNRSRPNPTPIEKIPNKIYYSISEASEYTGVEPHVLRYWETKFTKLNPKRVGGNQRKYTRNDIELLYEIVHLLYYEGFTLDGAERQLKIGLQALKAEREAKQSKQPIHHPPGRNHSVSNNSALHEIKNELKEILILLK